MGKWFLVDLHMHSYYSKKYDNKKVKQMSAKDFLGVLISHNIELFSITDHDCFSKEYYEEIKAEIKNNNLNIISIPGAELNVYVNENKFHANFYFPLDTNLDKLENSIHELYDNNNKPNFSDIIDKFNSNSFDFIIFPEADKAAGINNLVKELNKSGQIDEVKKIQKMGMQRIFRGYDSKERFNKISANLWAEEYYKNSVEFNKELENKTDGEIKRIGDKVHNELKNIHIKQDDKDYKIVTKIKNIIEEYAFCFPYFHFTDWHNAENYVPKANNYIYGDLEYPFETIELAVLDPLSRIKVYDLNTQINSKPSNHIKNLSFNMNGINYNIDFSLGLNAIIGKRASGKSLLMSILLKLSDKNNKSLENYKNINVDLNSIKCETYSGEKLGIGNLSSLTYIRQNEIANIFENPSETENTIKSNFNPISEIDKSKYNDILSELKKLNQYEENYKQFNEYIKNVNNFNTYSFIKINSIIFNDFETTFNKIFDEIENLKKLMINKGFAKFSIDKTENELKSIYKIYNKKINLYNSIINEINLEIEEIIKNNSKTNNNNQTINTNFEEANNIISKNIEILTHFKKLEFLINNFELNIPKPVFNKSDKFIFESFYEVDDDYKDRLIELIELPINKGKSKLGGFDLLKHYLHGNTTLKSGFNDLYAKFESTYLNKIIKTKYIMYEIKEDIDFVNIKDNIDDYIKTNKLENITESSLGRKSIAYLEYTLNTKDGILLFDQPEDNIDNNYISNYFVPIIKQKKNKNQLIFITHNPSVAVYSDAFNYIYAQNNDGIISYTNYSILKVDDKKEILKMLDGGIPSFSNRNLKYGNIIGEFTYGNQNNKK